MSFPFPLVLLLAVFPLVGAALVVRPRGPKAARQIGGVIAAIVLLAMGALLAQVIALGPGGRVMDPSIPLSDAGSRPLFGLDALSALLAMTNVITAFAVIVGAPRARDERPRISAILATEALVLIMLSSFDLIILAGAFVSLVFPARARLRPGREAADTSRLYRVVFLGGALPLAAAIAIIGFGAWNGGGSDLFDLRVVSPDAIPGSGVVLGLLLVTVFFRMALLPLHSWLPAMTQYGSLGSTVLLVASQSGVYLFVRVAFVFFPGDAGGLVPYLASGGIASALYAGLLALVQDDLRRLIGWLSVSQAGLMIVGLCTLRPDGMAGAVLYWISYGTAVTGLALCAWAVQARTGTTRISQLGGLVRSAPRLTVAFAAFAVASVGFPGSMGFVAEDLLVHGVIEAYPMVGALMIAATAINGIALLRALFRTFLGPARIDAPADLRPREMWVSSGLAAVAFGFGVWPASLIDVVALARLNIHF